MKSHLNFISLIITTALFIHYTVVIAQPVKTHTPTIESLFEWASMPDYTSYLTTSTVDSQGNWIAGGCLFDPLEGITMPVVVKLSPEGEQLWQYPEYFEWEVGRVTKICLDKDDNILVTGWCLMGCDYLPYGMFVHKISPEGEFIWKKILLSEEPVITIPQAIMNLTNENICIAARSELYFLSPDGDSLNTITFDMPPDETFTCGFATDYNILLAHANTIIKTDLSGNPNAVVSSAIDIADIFGFNNTYYFISGEKLLKTDIDFNILDDFEIVSIVSDDFVFTVDTTGYFFAGGGHFLQVDLNFEIQTNQTFDLPPGFQSASVSTYEDIVLLAGQTYPVQDNSAMAMKTWLFDGSTNDYDVDIGITSIVVDSIYTQQGGYPGDYNVNWNATLTIENFGSDTVYSCHASTLLDNYFLCGYGGFTFAFEGLELPPAGSVEVETGTIGVTHMFWPGIDSVLFTMNMYSAMPNELIDRNPSNNYESVTFMIDLISGVDEMAHPSLSVYPNPAEKFIKFDNPEKDRVVWSLYSLHGSLIKEGRFRTSNTEISLTGLATGIYYLQYKSNGEEPKVIKLIRK
ncbi:MAG: T9SS type A sorting domain-containing protein [Bacteroidales bacterium]|nr:T9SS type A sorting domain-containing protein [Bacteroidales bacterium]